MELTTLDYTLLWIAIIILVAGGLERLFSND